MEVTAAQLLTIMPTARERVGLFAEPLNAAMARWGIDTPLRVAHFLAQCAHESGEMRWLHEIWGPTPGQMAYEGRLDLGNTQSGDGKFFMGRGLIQVTGRGNYARCSEAIYGDEHLLETPETLETRDGACQSAGWFWASHGLNERADADDLVRITRTINGGLNGLNYRALYLGRAKQALGVAFSDVTGGAS